jgi:adenylate cyclase|tara:strand:- start:38159 stop:40021 length:1863 start_codon:yes stop_codon:yes gene_type:complete
MKKLLFLFCFSMMFSCVSAQLGYQKRVDSLLKIVNSSTVSPEQVNRLNQISKIYFYQAPKTVKDSSENYSLMAIEVARKINDKNGLATGLYDLGKYYLGVLDEATKATQYFLESLELYTEIKNNSGVAKCYMQLGLISYTLQYFEDAIRNFQLSLNYQDEATTNYLMAITYTEIDSFAQAKDHFSRAITFYTKSKHPEMLADCYLYLGRLYLKTKDYTSSFHFMKKAIEIRGFLEDDTSLSRPYAFLSELYLESGDLKKSIYYAKESYKMEIGKKGQHKDEISLIQATKVLSKAYAMKKNYKLSLFYLNLFNELNNRNFKGGIKQKVADMQSMFEFKQEMSIQKMREQKNKVIAEQQIATQKILRNSFLIGSLLLLLLLFGLYHRFKFKKRANLALLELNQIVTKEKKRSDELLLNILPQEIAEELKEKGHSDAQLVNEVTVLFTDFKGFTSLAEQMSATELVNDLNICFSSFDRIMEKYDIEKIKTIGDAYMAAGGLNSPSENSLKNTVLAAIEIQDFICKRKAEMVYKDLPAFEMRVGVHTGPVVAGIVGVIKFQYDIWGDTVNTASRMESSGEIGKVNISERTYELLRTDHDFIFEARGKIQAKGKGEMEMYFVSKS